MPDLLARAVRERWWRPLLAPDAAWEQFDPEVRRELGKIYDDLDRRLLAIARHDLWLPPIPAEDGTQRTEAAFDALLRAIEHDPVLMLRNARRRGNQPEPYKGDILQLLMRQDVTKLSAVAMLRLVGAKPPGK